MYRAAIENMAMLKKMIQSALDSGEINDPSQLLAVAAEHGLTVIRNGRDYAGFMTKCEKRFRVRFEFNDYMVSYFLLAVNGGWSTLLLYQFFDSHS